jgi:hypothetical protein
MQKVFTRAGRVALSSNPSTAKKINKTFDKFQYPFMVKQKLLSKLGPEWCTSTQ